MSPVAPLPVGFRLQERYVIERSLGSGGFGVSYLAYDEVKGMEVVIKEMMPSSCSRHNDGHIDFGQMGLQAIQRLRHQFLDEARRLQSIAVEGVSRVRDIFQENSTCYYVTDYYPSSKTLEQIQQEEGRLDGDWVADIILQVAEILRAIHERGFLHRDVKPSNLIITKKDKLILIDFGAAREWHADMTGGHTVVFTPGFAPIEQMSERARRGPATDIYGMCATAYTLLTGQSPPTAPDRVSGVPLTPLSMLRPDVDPGFAAAIEAGLRVNYDERPESIVEWLKLTEVAPDPKTHSERVADLDRRLVTLAKFRPGKRECPACHGILEEVKPLPPLTCPVCRHAKVLARALSPNLCPHCRTGRLHAFKNTSPLRICPICAVGFLEAQGLPNPFGSRKFACTKCTATFQGTKTSAEDESTGKNQTWDEWGEQSGRSELVMVCDGCQAQFDELDDPRWRKVHPVPGKQDHRDLFPDEWMMVAHGLEPGAGNAFCPECSADYYVDGERLTLLGTGRDPFDFGRQFQARCLDWETVRYLAVGKTSGNKGLVCGHCKLELDQVGRDWELVHTSRSWLRSLIGQPASFENLHRLSEGLPLVGEEHELFDQIEPTLRSAFRAGELPMDSRNPDTIWKGEAIYRGKLGSLLVTAEKLVFGGLIRSRSWPTSEITEYGADEEHFEFVIGGEEVVLEIPPVILVTQLQSGKHTIELTPLDLLERLEPIFQKGLA